MTTLMTVGHFGEVAMSTRGADPPTKRVKTKSLSTTVTLFGLLEKLCSTLWTVLLLLAFSINAAAWKI